MRKIISELKNAKAVIFDMDGLLVDSEPLWQIAEINIFKTIGINLTDEECKSLQGIRTEELVPIVFKKYNCDKEKIPQIVEGIIAEMLILLQTAPILPGVIETINFYTKKNIPMAIASSSRMVMIEQIVDRLQLRDKISVLHSAEYEKVGKPAPDIFFTTAKKLNFAASDCLVFEDSVFGVEAARRAEMMVVAVPPPENFNNPKYDIADYKVNSLTDWLKTIC